MEAFTKYRANDGAEFPTAEKALDHEALCAEIDRAMSHLPPRPNLPGCGFENGEGYVQHTEESVRAARNAVLDLVAREVKHQWVDQSRDVCIDPGYVARLIDYDGPLPRAWGRFSCIDHSCREWGQPYFALHPEKGKQVALNVPATASTPPE